MEIAGGSLDEYLAKQVVTAITKGFNREIALKLLNQDFTLKRDDMEFFLDESLNDFNDILTGSFAKSAGGKDKKK